jgi:hypothetical protein
MTRCQGLVHLLEEEVNCPPEDSQGCGMGRYDEILEHSPGFRPDALGLNW